MGVPEADPDPTIAFVVPSDARSARLARQRTAQLRPVIGEAMYSDLALLLSELIANSVRHANAPDTPIRVNVECRPHFCRAQVFDSGTGFDEPSRPIEPPDASAEGGYGLLLVSRVATRWGAERVTDGMLVWFELDDAEDSDGQP